MSLEVWMRESPVPRHLPIEVYRLGFLEEALGGAGAAISPGVSTPEPPAPAPVVEPARPIAHAAVTKKAKRRAPLPERSTASVHEPLAALPTLDTRDEAPPSSAGQPTARDGGALQSKGGGIPGTTLAHSGSAAPGGAGSAGSGTGSRDDAWVAPILRQLRRELEAEREYPRIARRLGLEGTVTLQAEVETDGSVRGWDIVARSAHPVLDEAALAAARRIALVRTGAPIPRQIIVVVPLRFVLERASSDGS